MPHYQVEIITKEANLIQISTHAKDKPDAIKQGMKRAKELGAKEPKVLQVKEI